MIQTIEQTIIRHNLASGATPVVVMVSGGSDSTALAYLIHDLHAQGLIGKPAILHVNHLLRGREAYEDQKFVETLAQFLDIPFFACEIDVAHLAQQSGGNIEAVGRNERYLAAHEALESLCRYEALPVSEGRIVTAHTQDDRVENFYMRSIKGTGPGGFRSMLYQNGPVIRPCLDVSRLDLRRYIQDRALSEESVIRDTEGNLWREDATNAHTDKFRAYIRHEIIPRAKEKNERLLDTLCRTMNLIADEDDYLNQVARTLYEEHVEWVSEFDADTSPKSTADSSQKLFGCRLLPSFGSVALPLKRRVVHAVLEALLGTEARIETASVEAVLASFDESGAPKSGYVANIQGNLAVSSNKNGTLIEPMQTYRKRRKRT